MQLLLAMLTKERAPRPSSALEVAARLDVIRIEAESEQGLEASVGEHVQALFAEAREERAIAVREAVRNVDERRTEHALADRASQPQNATRADRPAALQPKPERAPRRRAWMAGGVASLALGIATWLWIADDSRAPDEPAAAAAPSDPVEHVIVDAPREPSTEPAADPSSVSPAAELATQEPVVADRRRPSRGARTARETAQRDRSAPTRVRPPPRDDIWTEFP